MNDELWVGFDLDGTLAVHNLGDDMNTIGEPVFPMIARLLHYLKDGTRCKIMTARGGSPEQILLVKAWLKKHDLPDLEVTNVKDFCMLKLYDDRAEGVATNTGIVISEVLDAVLRGRGKNT